MALGKESTQEQKTKQPELEKNKKPEQPEQSENHSQSISENDRIETLLSEVQVELNELNPQIEQLEETLNQLRELKAKKQKLLALKMSLESVLNNFNLPSTSSQESSEASLIKASNYATAPQKASPSPTLDFEHQVFYPDKAFEETKHLLKKKGSLNYEMYRAIVFNGGKATTEEIRQYLIEHQLTLPTTGQTFDEVSLTQVSSRVNYLVRKDIIRSIGRGYFASNYGWGEASL